jgi:hypothetical protein
MATTRQQFCRDTLNNIFGRADQSFQWSRAYSYYSSPYAQKEVIWKSGIARARCIPEVFVIHMDLNGHPPFSLNHHFEPMVLINHDIHPFDGEWNVMPSSFVNYKHHVMIS